jgi:hypothetical protein
MIQNQILDNDAIYGEYDFRLHSTSIFDYLLFWNGCMECGYNRIAEKV